MPLESLVTSCGFQKSWYQGAGTCFTIFCMLIILFLTNVDSIDCRRLIINWILILKQYAFHHKCDNVDSLILKSWRYRKIFQNWRFQCYISRYLDSTVNTNCVQNIVIFKCSDFFYMWSRRNSFFSSFYLEVSNS